MTDVTYGSVICARTLRYDSAGSHLPAVSEVSSDDILLIAGTVIDFSGNSFKRPSGFWFL